MQPQPDSSNPDDSDIQRRFQLRESGRAAELIDRSLQRSPRDALMLYNAACARALLNEHDLAGQFLLKSVQAGFKDFSHMRRDPDLISMRDHPVYRALIDARDSADAMLAKREVDKWRTEHGEEFYRYEHDEAGRLWFISSLDDTQHEAMRAMLDRESEQLSRTLFGHGPRHQIIVIVPTPADAAKLLPDRHVHGSYKHMRGVLIAADTGAALRHEFVHALHHNHMDQLGQQHPLWIQEGLAALYEDYELNDDGTIVFLPNERRNVAKSMARENRLMPMDQFIAQGEEAFAARPGPNYVQARAVFEYLADHNLLDSWYAEYVTTFQRDSSGALALSVIFGQSVQDIAADWRRWLDDQPTVVTQNHVKRPSTGFDSNKLRHGEWE
jgi:hypothetical protein